LANHSVFFPMHNDKTIKYYRSSLYNVQCVPPQLTGHYVTQANHAPY